MDGKRTARPAGPRQDPERQRRAPAQAMKKVFWFLMFFVQWGNAFAQFPSRPVTLVVPFTNGTGIDILARTIGPRLAERWKKPVVVENKPGASGNIGADAVAKAAGDGHTLMVTVNTFTITPSLFKNVPYDAEKD